MSTTDTLRTAETLTEAGVPERQAAGHARAIEDAATEAVGDLVTRADLAQLEVRLVRILLIQTGVIIGAVVALLRLIP
jgi:hypothetical protein